MKTLSYILVIGILMAGNALFAQKAKVDTKNSTIEWYGKKITGQHNGHILLKSGHLEIEDDRIIAGIFTVDMASITVEDIENENYNQKLVNHLKSDDFFGVEAYPTAQFVVKQSTKFINGKATLEGDMTIKGNTERISFEVTKSGYEYVTQIDIDRSKYDVRYGSNSFFDNLGDKAISDIFTLDIRFITTPQIKDLTQK